MGWSFLAAAGVFAAELPFRHLTPRSERVRLPSASVQAILQDRDGYVWLGFYSSGLSRLDGTTLENYGVADGLLHLTVRHLVQDARGHLWVGSDGGLVVSERPLQDHGIGERVRFVDHIGDQRLVKSRIRQNGMAADAEGRVWVASTAGLIGYRIAPGSRQDVVTPAFGTPTAQRGLAVVARRDGSVWAAREDGNVLAFQGAELVREIPVGAQLAGCVTRCLFEGRDQSLWGACASGALWRMGSNGAPEIVNTQLTSPVFAMAESHAGDLWATTLGGGVLRLPLADPGRGQILTRRDGLLGDTAWAVLEDRERTLWIGQNGGLSRLRQDWRAFLGHTSTSLNAGGALAAESNSFASLPPTRSGEPQTGWLWVATGGGIAVVDQTHDRTQTLTIADGFHSNSMYTLLRDADGRVWAGGDRGLSVVTPAGVAPPPGLHSTRSLRIFDVPLQVHQVRMGSILPVYRVTAVPAQTPEDEILWVGGGDGARSLSRDGWRLFGTAAGIPADGTTTVAQDDFGFVWVGTNETGMLRSTRPLTSANLERVALSGEGPGGARRVAQRVFEPVWNRDKGARTNRMTTVLPLGDEVWTGSDTGITRFRASGAAAERLAHIDLPGPIAGMDRDPRTGDVWASTGRGLARIDRRSGRVVALVSASDGLLSDEAWAFNTVSVGADGVIYTATAGGLTLYRPELVVKSDVPPIVRIRRAAWTQDLMGQNALDVEYASLSFVNEAGVRYRTRLRGYEGDWSAEKGETRVRYTNLSAWLLPKTYTFEVMGSNGHDVWSREPATFSFVVHPPVWRRWWALLGFGALLVAAAAGVERLRSGRLRRRAADLESVVAARTHELNTQKADLETFDGIVREINSRVDLRGLVAALLEQGMVLFPHAQKAVYLSLDRERDRVEVLAARGYEPSELRSFQFTVAETLARYRSAPEVLLPGVYRIRDWSDLPGSERLQGLPVPRAMLSMEVTLDGRTEGLVVFDNFTDDEAFSQADLLRLSRYREHAASAISKARALAELQVQREAADRANRAKGDFLAMMSHEIRTPLNAVLGFAQLMERRRGRDEADRGHLAAIRRSGEHLVGLLNDVLSLSRIEAGGIPLQRTAFDLGTLLRGTTEMLRDRAESKSLILRCEVQPGLPGAVLGDEVRLRQVLINLLGNAIKFTARGSVTLRGAWSNGRASIEVEDTGPGIGQGDAARLFEPFVQAEAGRAAAEGTGLGLALSRQIVRLMDGDIQIDSEVGRGTRFHFQIALPPSAEASFVSAEQRSVARLAPGQPSWRVLIVDDQADNRTLLGGLLRSAGFEVREADGGESAIETWRSFEPHLIWMDKRMPDLDGLEATRRIRAEEHTTGRGRVGIVALSASVLEHERLEILAAGCDGFVAKPLRAETIFVEMGALIGCQYVYDEPAEPISSPVEPDEPTRLDEALRARLLDAASGGDRDAALEVLAEIAVSSPALAARLETLARRFDFEALAEVVRLDPHVPDPAAR